MDEISALIIIRMQNDYISTDYSGDNRLINCVQLINKYRKKFNFIIFIQDWFSRDHAIFKNNKIRKCIAGTYGAKINEGLIIDHSDYIIHINTINLYTSNSAFYNVKSGNVSCESDLKNILGEHLIKKIYLCGIDLENQIFSTALDANTFGYECCIIRDLSVGQDEKKIEICLNYLKTIGIKIINYKELDLIQL